MFERFTDRARRVVVLAQEEARRLHHPYIAPEHILLGLLRNDGLAAKALQSLGIDLEEARRQIEEGVGMGTGPALEAHIPFTRGSKKVLELSLREALSLGHNYIGTEHILLGVLRESEGDPDALVRRLGVDLERVRAQVIEMLAEYAPSGSQAQGAGARAGLRGMLPPEWSPALLAVERRARTKAAGSQVTTGHVLLAILGDLESQGAKALSQLGVSVEAVGGKLGEIPLAETSDAPPPPPSVDFTVGGRTMTIGDPAVAAALGAMSPDDLRAALRKAIGADPEPGASDPEAGAGARTGAA